ncbi:MAG: arginine--tRNA ligase [Bacteroidales bacterium]|nr:arginine--tRNA ligase [Bacteroidales bacterium]
MDLNYIITRGVSDAVHELYGEVPDLKSIQLQKTRKEFDGDITVVVFPFLRISKKSPESTAKELGEYLQKKIVIVKSFNVIKGFLNIDVSSTYYVDFLRNHGIKQDYGKVESKGNSELYMVEYSSPNTNKPLHLGHIRNNLLGWSVSKILEASGKRVVKTNIVNDRGIHICKSMLAWQKWGKGETPENSEIKGDHLVGKYYVKFDQEYKNQITALINKGEKEEDAAKNAPLLLEAQDMLRRWEDKDPEVIHLWEMMNGWVYDGFDVTYKRLGVEFDKIYYESDTYTVGRDTVLEGLKKGVFIQHEDNSVWADLTNDGLDQKILLRSDGTSVYMTQDIGTAQMRQNDYPFDKMVYVVGNEQNYHFKVLAIILDKLGFPWAKNLYHMSYGMVELPDGKMKSREGTVVDADDLMDEMIDTSREMANELGKLEGLTSEEKEETYRIIGLGALKYFILKVDPVKNMMFNPRESIDFNGNTGPFIQYTHARICSVLRKAKEMNIESYREYTVMTEINDKEKSLLKILHDFPEIVKEAADNYSPALIANYMYEITKEFNQFYHDYTIIKESNLELRNFRISLSEAVGKVIKNGMNLMGIEVPERM